MSRLTEALPSAMCMANLNCTAGSGEVHRPGTRRGTILPLDKDLFGAQAYVKGGIGHYVAQGLARRGYSSNPRHQHFSPGNTMKTLKQELQSHGIASGENMDESDEVFRRPAFEYEHFDKDAAFKSASRSTRCKDLDHASKWAAMSFFETDPRRVRHHIEILEDIEQTERIDAIVARESALEKRTAVKDRIRHAFRVLQLQNAVRSVKAGQQARAPAVLPQGPSSCQSLKPSTAPANRGSHRGSAPNEYCSPKRSYGAAQSWFQPREAWGEVPKESWGEQPQADCARSAAHPGTAQHLPTREATLSGRQMRPQTARPFRIRTQMEQEVQLGFKKAHRAMSARPGSQRRQEPSAQEVMQELDRFQQMLDLQQSRGIRSAVYF